MGTFSASLVLVESTGERFNILTKCQKSVTVLSLLLAWLNCWITSRVGDYVSCYKDDVTWQAYRMRRFSDDESRAYVHPLSPAISD